MRFLVIILLSFWFIDVSAQNSRDVTYQDIILSCYDVLNEYEKNCSFSNEDRYTEFNDMFVDSSNLHTNDIPALNKYNSSLTVDNYMKRIRKYYNRMNVDLKVNSFSKVEYFTDSAEISVFINKSISGISTNSIPLKTYSYIIKKDNMYLSYGSKYVSDIDDAIFYESKNEVKEKIKKLKEDFPNDKYSIVNEEEELDEFIPYEDNFNLRIDFIINLKSDTVYEIKLKKVDLVDEKLPLIVIIPSVSKFYNQKKKDYRYNMPLEFSYNMKGKDNKIKWMPLTVDGYFLSLNKGEKIKVRPPGKLYYKTYSLDPSKENIDVNSLRELNFLEYTLSLGASIFIPSNKINFLPNSIPASFVINQVDLTNNIDIKAELNLIRNKTIFLNVTYNVTQNSFNQDVIIDNYNYSYIDIDSDELSYLRIIDLNNIRENQSIETSSSYISLTVGREFLYDKKNKKTASISVSWSPSIIKGNYKILSATYNSTANAMYSGYYQDLAGITFSENGVYDFGEYQITGSGNIIEPIEFTSSQIDVNISFKISPRFSLNAGWRQITFENNVFNFGDPMISNDFNKLNSIMNISPIDMKQSIFLVGINYSM